MDLPPISPDAELLLFTSGTTGKPKPVRKIVRLLDREAEMVSEIFPDLRRLAVASSVDPLHLYGLTFTVWVPMALGGLFRGLRYRKTWRQLPCPPLLLPLRPSFGTSTPRCRMTQSALSFPLAESWGRRPVPV